ncbi:TetR/AcrR family transcriptional regulator [Sphingomonas sp. HF-S4]|uniref:TetR/AcrR family transcriptional regulator n=1 Tax=Sphingomonas agrestis TaxID=3080540 RepID=A0ABU3YBT6_9SPHN|nr:TetR/AcrR family transcriptional regulator [Sphingomonas sp. HF-S4]MDV3458836.1 TetR/AcrR family transcriptional regulator [Sphingomonas sp. HF-S4]
MPSKGRGRPRSFDPDEALGRATERFRTQGYAGTSLDDLSEATGLKRPSLAAAFGDKRAMYLAAIDRLTMRIDRQLQRLGEMALAPRELVERILLGGIALYLTGSEGPEGCLIINTAATQAASDPQVRAKVGTFLAVEDGRIAELLAAAGSAAPEAQGRLVASVLHSLSVRARGGASREELERVAHDCIDLIFGAGN